MKRQSRTFAAVTVALVTVLFVGRLAYAWLGERDASEAAVEQVAPSGAQTAAGGNSEPEALADFDVTVYDVDGNALLLSSRRQPWR